MQLVAERQSVDTAGSLRGLRTDEVAQPQTFDRRSSLEQSGEEAAVERITGACGVDDRDARCFH